MTMFTQEMLAAAAADPQLAEHLKAAAAAYAATAFEAALAANAKEKAKAEAEAQAKAEAKAKAEAEAKAQDDFLKAYPEGYVYVQTAAEVTRLKAAAREVNLHARTFVEEVVDDSFIKVVFMRPKKGGKKA